LIRLRFVDYILAALVKQGCHHQYDIEGSLQRIIFKMLGKVGERGLPHKSLFDFDESRPFNLRLGNPLQVVFKKYLANEIRAISLGCIPALRTIQHPGRLSIGYDRDDPGTVLTCSPKTDPCVMRVSSARQGKEILVDGVPKRQRRGSVAAVQFGGAPSSVSGSREDGGFSLDLLQLHREVQECDPAWSFGKRFVGWC
jgi:hypothetical protein